MSVLNQTCQVLRLSPFVCGCCIFSEYWQSVELWPDGGIRALVLAFIASNLLAWAFAHATEAHY